MDDAQKLDAVRRGKLPYTNAANGGSLGLVCNALPIGGAVVVFRNAGVWEVAMVDGLPDDIVSEIMSRAVNTGTGNTVHNALWEAMR